MTYNIRARVAQFDTLQDIKLGTCESFTAARDVADAVADAMEKAGKSKIFSVYVASDAGTSFERQLKGNLEA